MYTYESFETLGVFTLLRPIFFRFLIISLLLLIKVILPITKMPYINGFTIANISIISAVVFAQVVFYNAIIVDETGLRRDEFSSYMFLIIVVLAFINPLVYFYKENKK
ncbi:hypothetical protein [Metabacillus fastidiosus]|uniref:hypothetical protein n=1 Tax=Metabacillus fastidiosus TaxID=1458 RepID=UPI003D2CA015